MTACPFCSHVGGRSEVHAHLVDEHPDQVQTWAQAESGRMRYRIVCPRCGAEHEARVKPRSLDPHFLEGFAREIRLVAFDMLLCHLEAEHGEGVAPAEHGEEAPRAEHGEEAPRAEHGEEARPPERAEGVAQEDAPPRAKLPAAGPGGGRGRPGAEGVPLPPGMAEPQLPAWMRAAAELKVKQVKPSGEKHDGSAGLRHP